MLEKFIEEAIFIDSIVNIIQREIIHWKFVVTGQPRVIIP